MEQAIEKTRRYTLEEYFRLEYDSEEKHEFRDGEIISVAGTTLEHSRITVNAIIALGNRLKGSSCTVFDSNLRTQIARKKLYGYPDVIVICGTPVPSSEDGRGMTYTNPRLTVEVLSPSTEHYDRTTKFDRYRELESFQEYVLIAQNTARVESYFRHPDGVWRFNFALGIDASIPLPSLSISLPLSEVYEGVVFPPVIEPKKAAFEESD